MRLCIKWWFIRTFQFNKTFSCYNERLESYNLGEVYQEWTKFYYIKAGKHLLYIRYK